VAENQEPGVRQDVTALHQPTRLAFPPLDAGRNKKYSVTLADIRETSADNRTVWQTPAAEGIGDTQFTPGHLQ
jgi:hypothetical protein